MTFWLPPPQTTRERFSGVIRGLTGMLRSHAPSGVMPDWMAALQTRLQLIGQVISVLLLAMQAGTLPMRRSPAPSGTRRRAAMAATPAPVGMRLPGGRAWLVKLMGWQAACFRGQLETVLADPEMVALLAVSARARRVVRPLCRMLGVELPATPVPPAPPTSPRSDRPLRRLRRHLPREKRERSRSDPPPPAGEVARSDGGGSRPFKNRAGEALRLGTPILLRLSNVWQPDLIGRARPSL